ncbi:MAG: triose-phosphate isomerase [Candidatus Westeberhardia cardiocondylae]|nr:triose-phosphate isomerase [Candidatus Westeberhardia cardiocondylae]
MKYSFIIGNWKLYGNKNMIHNFFSKLQNKININSQYKIIITPPFVYLDLVNKYLSKIPNFYLGAQNVDIHSSGPFTGEISAKMLQDIGVKYVFIGHSERKINHNENNKHIIKKFSLSKESKLIPILCIGENVIEHQNNKTQKICEKQINTIIDALGISSLKNTIIAYEPIWSIGTGKTPLIQKVEKIINKIRSYLNKKNKNISTTISILYGGSINETNAIDFLKIPNINGVLIGNASIHSSTFLNIAKNLKK